MTRWLTIALQDTHSIRSSSPNSIPNGPSGPNGSASVAANDNSTTRVPRAYPGDPQGWIDEYEELAAILEFDRGLTRQEAQQHAYNTVHSYWLDAHPQPYNTPKSCLGCNDQGLDLRDDLMPLADGAWVHYPECHALYQLKRQIFAEKALADLGIPHPAYRIMVT